MTFTYTNNGDAGVWVGDVYFAPSGSKSLSKRSVSFEQAVKNGVLTLAISGDPDPVPQSGFTILFDKGSHGGLCAPIKYVQSGATVQLPTPEQTDDFGFFGWFTQKGGKGEQYTDETPITGNITLYPLWKKYWTVSFDKNGGTGEMADVKVLKDGKYTVPACGFTAPEGKVFDTWMNGETAVAVEKEITVAADTTLKATWKDA